MLNPQMLLQLADIKRHLHGLSKIVKVNCLLELLFFSVYCKGSIQKLALSNAAKAEIQKLRGALQIFGADLCFLNGC